MSSKSQNIEIIGVDTDTLEKDETFKEAYAFYIKLSDEPDSVWQNYLSKWKNTLDAMQLKIEVAGDRLRLVFVFGDDIESYAKYAEQLVKWVNERVIEYNKRMDSLEKTELGKQQERQRKEEDIRRRLRRLEPEPIPTATEVTVEELASAYETNEEKARARFGNKFLKVTGLVNRIGVRDEFDTQYIALGYGDNSAQIIRCTFEKKDSDRIRGLTRGQKITVQGEFTGSLVQLSMRNCTLTM